MNRIELLLALAESEDDTRDELASRVYEVLLLLRTWLAAWASAPDVTIGIIGPDKTHAESTVEIAAAQRIGRAQQSLRAYLLEELSAADLAP